MSRDGCAALPRGATGCLRFVIAVFPDHTHLLFSILLSNAQHVQISYEPRSDKRDLLAIKVKSEIFTEKERPSCCEQLQKI